MEANQQSGAIPVGQPESGGPVWRAFAMLTLDGKANGAEMYRTMSADPNVTSCEATKGDCDLLLTLHAESLDDLNTVIDQRITSRAGINAVTVLPVFETGSAATHVGETGRVASEDASPTGVSSYVLLEIEKEKLGSITTAIAQHEQIATCDCTNGKWDLILLVKGESFPDIDATIRARIRPIDGVLRIKEYPIINFIEH